VSALKLTLLTGLASLFSLTVLSHCAAANSDPLLQATEPDDAMTSVTAVAELSDVKPTDWAYTALASLVERYGIVMGDGKGRFWGDRRLSRTEFAAGLNQAMVQMEALLNSEMAQYATQEDLETLRKLQEEFARELAAAKASLDVSTQTERLQQQSFSATTKLNGEVVFLVSGVGRGEKVDGAGEPIDSELTIGDRVNLDFDTSFSGKDQLNIGFKTGNLTRLDRATGTDMARLGLSGDRDNQLELGELGYRFPLGDRARVRVMAVGGSLSDFVRTLNPLLDGTSDGAISRFGQRNPIYRQGSGTGIGITYKFSDAVRLSLGYLARRANNPQIGFRQADHGVIAQLTLSPIDELDLAITYVHSHNSLDTGTGSQRANDPFRDRSDAVTGNSLGVQAAIALSPQILLTGWAGWTHARAIDLPDNPAAQIFNWATTLAIQDLGKKGNLLGVAIGQPPKLVRNDFLFRGREYTDPATSLHLEVFYQWQIVNNLAITLGWFMVTNPEHNRNHNPIHIGTLRTTFQF
jgi:hypothetical protein